MSAAESSLTPKEIADVRDKAKNALGGLKPASGSFGHYASGKRTLAGRQLPPYYIVYFLFVELLRFSNMGLSEKVAWSIPIELNGHLLFVEHRKLGLGIFCAAKGDSLLQDASPNCEEVAKLAVKLIHRASKIAEPFFAHLAREAMRRSELNVSNDGPWLYSRYEFALKLFQEKLAEADASRGQTIATEHPNAQGVVRAQTTVYPEFKLRQQVEWLGIGAIEAFFSWTEHVFIHIAILLQKVTTGDEVDRLAFAEWQTKAKAALDLSHPVMKAIYDDLVFIRRQIRNFMAHGAFGKSGEALRFHSPAGAVPITLSDFVGRYAISAGTSFDTAEALVRIQAFVDEFWKGRLEPAALYIQEAGLPTILTFARDGTYADAMSSVDEMRAFVDVLSQMMDDAANMDW